MLDKLFDEALDDAGRAGAKVCAICFPDVGTEDLIDEPLDRDNQRAVCNCWGGP